MNFDAKNVVFYSIFRSGDSGCLSIREELISLWREPGATWEEVQKERQGVWSREPGGGRERRSGAEEREPAISNAQTANVKTR